MSTDDGYISNYLIHWTGKKGDPCGAETLSIIASTCELLFSYNRIHTFDMYHQIHEKMICFTDVPLTHSLHHCQRYGRFGIAFQKLKLMNMGAQPVFYVSHVWKDDMDIIYKFLQEQTENTTLEPTLFRALHRHFYFMQRFSDKRADEKDIYYYEREWRLGSQSLPTLEELDRANAKYHCIEEGYPRYIGKRRVNGEDEYFAFEPDDVAFLIAPDSWKVSIKNPHCFRIESYENFILELDKAY
jgi:hypothetical protein